MGLDVVAISHANLVKCPGDDSCDAEEHFTVDARDRRRDALKPGCYIALGPMFSFRGGTSIGYNHWRRELSLLALGVQPEAVWKNPHRYRGKPFVELIDFSDSTGVIGPKTSAKLYADFETFAPKARNHFLGAVTQNVKIKKQPKPPARSRKNVAAFVAKSSAIDDSDRTWMWNVYRDFQNAFKLASDHGLVIFE